MKRNRIHKPKIRKTVTRVKGHEYPRYVLDYGLVDGKRKRENYATKADAVQALRVYSERQKILSKKIGDGSKRFLSGNVQDASAAMEIIGRDVSLVDAASGYKALKESGLAFSDIRDAAAALSTLKKKGTLSEAAEFYMDRNFPDGDHRKIADLVEDYIESRKQAQRRDATIRDIRQRLGQAMPRNIERKGGGILRVSPFGFAKDFADTPAAHITTSELEAWMKQHAGKSRSTLNGYRVHLVGLFNYAMERKFTKTNPAKPIVTIKSNRGGKPSVLTVEECESVMKCAAAVAPETIPFFALGLFAGIRPSGEMSRLLWPDIDFRRREIHIRSDVSKTGDERFIEMSDNLFCWLALHKSNAGLVCASRAAVAKVRKLAGVHWSPDVMRHSFGSYHMAAHDNAGKTALQMGHRAIDTLFAHYRRAVHKEDAERFWAIKPNAGEGVLRFPVPKAG